METVSEDDLDRREARLRRLTASVPYALLATSTTLTLITGDLPWPEPLELFGLVALATALMWGVARSNPDRASRPWSTGALVLALIVLIAMLSARGVWFAIFFGFVGYLYSWQFLRGRWRFVGVTATAAITVTVYMGESFQTPSSVLLYLFFVACVVTLVAVFSQIGEVTAQRSDERRRMVERLRETIRENEGLHAQLLVQAREAGIHDERERMAQEIHDTLAQGFVGIITQLQAAERAMGADESESRVRVEGAIRLARENLAEARRSVHALGPAPLESTPLAEALAELTKGWSRLHGVRAEFTTTGRVSPLHHEVEATLLRTVQESLSNVARHAEASRVGVTLSYMEDLVVLDVRDDGVGFASKEAKPESGFGLTSMHQRVSRLAGALEIESEPGVGTAVCVSLPAIAREGSDG